MASLSSFLLYLWFPVLSTTEQQQAAMVANSMNTPNEYSMIWSSLFLITYSSLSPLIFHTFMLNCFMCFFSSSILCFLPWFWERVYSRQTIRLTNKHRNTTINNSIISIIRITLGQNQLTIYGLQCTKYWSKYYAYTTWQLSLL